MSKDKKKKKDKKHDKKGNGSAVAKVAKVAKVPKKAAAGLQAITQNPLVADVVAAALISMAAALKDSDKAKRLASDAGDQLDELSKKTGKQGGPMWDLALTIGRRAMETIASEQKSKGNSARK